MGGRQRWEESAREILDGVPLDRTFAAELLETQKAGVQVLAAAFRLGLIPIEAVVAVLLEQLRSGVELPAFDQDVAMALPEQFEEIVSDLRDLPITDPESEEVLLGVAEATLERSWRGLPEPLATLSELLSNWPSPLASSDLAYLKPRGLDRVFQGHASQRRMRTRLRRLVASHLGS